MRAYAAGFLAIFAVGCTAASPEPSAPRAPIEHVTLRFPGGFDQIALEGDRIFSPHMEVARYDDEYRGHAFRKAVSLRARDLLIEGIVGSDHTELYIQKFDDGFSVRGLYGGHLGHLRVRADRLEGQLGGRAFQLQRSLSDPRVYRSQAGPMALSAPPAIVAGHIGAGPTELTLPASFEALSTERQAMLLTLFLGR